MPERICAVAAENIIDTERFSFRFIAFSKAPVYFQDIAVYGTLFLREKSQNFLNPWTLTVGSDGLRRWEINLNDKVTYASIDEDDGDFGLRDLLSDLPECVILTEKSLIDRLAAACAAQGIRLDVHHYDGSLKTS